MSNTFTQIQKEERKAQELIKRSVNRVSTLLDEVKDKAEKKRASLLEEGKLKAKEKLEEAKKDIGKSHLLLKDTYTKQVKDLEETVKQKKKNVVESASKKFFQFISS